MSELVTVYIPTHNRLKLLKEAVESVLHQSYNNIELIICDDGSTDGTQDYLTQLILKNNNITYFRNELPRGACYSRNVAIKNANGKYITGLDDDDTFEPNRIQTLYESFDDKSHSFVCSPIFAVFESYKKITYRKRKLITLDDLLYYNFVGNQVFTLTDRLKAIGGFDETFKSCQDYDVWVRLVKEFGPGFRNDIATYNMLIEHGFNRITFSNNKSIGHQQFITKHKDMMNSSQIKSFEYFTAVQTGLNLDFNFLISKLSPKMCLKQVYSFFNHKVSK